jgi:hypothetical protein
MSNYLSLYINERSATQARNFELLHSPGMILKKKRHLSRFVSDIQLFVVLLYSFLSRASSFLHLPFTDFDQPSW